MVFGKAANDPPTMTNDNNTRSQTLAQYYSLVDLTSYNPYNNEHWPYTSNDGTKDGDPGLCPEAVEQLERE